MSTILLQLGQCGNQLGPQFFMSLAEVLNQSSVSEEFVQVAKERFFSSEDETNKMYPRAVLVDTEPKVIRESLALAKENGVPYRENSAYFQPQGAGNNWAMGFYEHGQVAKEPVLELIRKESEQCNFLEGFNMFMSVAGGTGSGLGAFFTETLKDEYPGVPIMNEVVYPFRSGEVIVQAHNAMLTLSHLQDSSDAVLIFENDKLYSICSERLHFDSFCLENMNDVACCQLLSFLLPSQSASKSPRLFGDILSHLVGHPQFKLLNLHSEPQEPVKSRPFSSYAWKSLLRDLGRMTRGNRCMEEGVSESRESITDYISIANLLIARGSEADSVTHEALNQPIPLRYASWVPAESRIQTWHSSVKLFGQDKTATLAYNGQSIIPCIDDLMDRSWTMFNTKAFLHHYEACGLEKDTFLDCFAQIEQLIASYKAISSI